MKKLFKKFIYDLITTHVGMQIDRRSDELELFWIDHGEKTTIDVVFLDGVGYEKN